jgi:hypothetical protein
VDEALTYGTEIAVGAVCGLIGVLSWRRGSVRTVAAILVAAGALAVVHGAGRLIG